MPIYDLQIATLWPLEKHHQADACHLAASNPHGEIVVNESGMKLTAISGRMLPRLVTTDNTSSEVWVDRWDGCRPPRTASQCAKLVV